LRFYCILLIILLEKKSIYTTLAKNDDMVEKKENLKEEVERAKAIKILKDLIGMDEVSEVKGEMPEIYHDLEALEKMQYTLDSMNQDDSRKMIIAINQIISMLNELLKLDKYRYANGNSVYQHFLEIKDRMNANKWEIIMKYKSLEKEDTLKSRISLMEWLRPLIGGIDKIEEGGLKLTEEAAYLIGNKSFFGEKKTTVIGLLDQAISLQEQKREKYSFTANQLRKMRDNLKSLRINDIYLIKHMHKIISSLSFMAQMVKALIKDYNQYSARPDWKLKRRIEGEEYVLITSYEDLCRHA
jgi:hypothetical protein